MDKFLTNLGPKTTSSASNAQGGTKKDDVAAHSTSQPWVEKYRPKTIEDVTSQEHTVSVLRKTLEQSNLPHMLFYGPPGTGKTSTILALCRQLYGPDAYKSRVLELNASDERGISIVREKVRNFAKAAIGPPTPGYPSPPYKIIILDEADSMTQDAQSALRRIMETSSHITRFCLICNYVTRIIEPLTSRCSKFRFKPLDSSNAIQRLRDICTAESVECGDDALETMVRVSDGDLRRAITYLQSAARLHGTAPATPITPRSVQEIAGVVPDDVAKSLANALGIPNNGDKDVEMSNGNVSSFDRVRAAIEDVVRQGYSATQVLLQLHEWTVMNPTLSSRAKSAIALHLGEADKCLTDGADEELQLLDTACKIQAAVVHG